MELDELILDALAYRRHVGASLGDIRAFVGIREKTQHPLKDDLAVLRRLEETGKLVKLGTKWFLTPTGYREARGSALEPTWNHHDDPWILLALLYNRDKAASRLADIVATADFINHAIPSRAEMHGALNRLLAGRLIERKGDRYAVTEKALELFAKVEASCRKSVQHQLDGLQRIMDCPCCGVQLKSVRWRIVLDAPTFEDAVEAYHKSVK